MGPTVSKRLVSAMRFSRRFQIRRPSRLRNRRGVASGGGLAMSLALFGGYVSEAWNGALGWVNHLDRNAWLIVLCCAVVIGTMCLRGFGSRSDY